MKRTWNLDGLRKHAKAIGERPKSRNRKATHIAPLSPREREVCAKCGVIRWHHENGALRPDHDFQQLK
jgi:hypothetical protein